MSLDGLPDLGGEYPLSAATVQEFRRDGHVLLRGVARPEELAAYRPFVEEAVAGVVREGDRQGRLDDYGNLFTQVTNAWRRHAGVRRLVFSRRFAQLVARLLGARGVRLYHDQALFKEPSGLPTPWHQDKYYWPLDTDRAATLWLPLVDVTEDMGPMRFASGSHRVGRLSEGPISGEAHARLERLVAERGFPVASAPLHTGDATVHLSRTLHSAGANRTRVRREVLTIIYFADNTRVLEPDNPNREADLRAFLPGLQPGDLAASELNPLLYGAESREHRWTPGRRRLSRAPK